MLSKATQLPIDCKFIRQSGFRFEGLLDVFLALDKRVRGVPAAFGLVSVDFTLLAYSKRLYLVEMILNQITILSGIILACANY